jgi:hypothetical protein
LLLVLVSTNLVGCKEKGESQDVREQAAVERVEKVPAVDQGDLIDSNGMIKLRILCTTIVSEQALCQGRDHRLREFP